MVKVKIYARTGCPYCDNARKWFKDRSIAIELILLDDINERQNWYKDISIKLQTQISTVPQIWVKDQHIGGYTDLLQKNNIINEILNGEE